MKAYEDMEDVEVPTMRRTRRPSSEWEGNRRDESAALHRLLVSGDAACANDVIPDRFTDQQTTSLHLRVLCQRCPISKACLEYALDHNVEGVWGGTTKAERARMRTHLGRKAPEQVGFTPYLEATRKRT